MKSDSAEKDLEILRVLQQDCEGSQKALARKIGISEPAFSARLSFLKVRGVIKRTAMVLNPAKSGFHSLCFFTVECAGGKGNDVSKVLFDYPEVQEIHVLDGTSPLLVKARTRHNAEMGELQGKILRIEGVRAVHGQIAMHTAKETLDLPI